MGEYYLDIETYSPGVKPDPVSEKIITIQYQKLSTRDGATEGDLQILTEWGFGSERSMLEAFKKVFLTGNDWDFIPIGVNLVGFDLLAILARLNFHFNLNIGLEFLRSKPSIDLKPVLVMKNHGNFSGYSDFLGKKESHKVKEWYELGKKTGDYQPIIDYVTREAHDFVQLYQTLKQEIPKIQWPTFT
jgi:hypothetical protein